MILAACSAAHNAAYAIADKVTVPSFSADDHDENRYASAYALECKRQCRLFRDIFGNPFRPVTLNPAWRTANAVALAQSIYDDRAFERMPILADALEDADCDNADILEHCRRPSPTEHVRGCWVVDLVLGKK